MLLNYFASQRACHIIVVTIVRHSCPAPKPRQAKHFSLSTDYMYVLNNRAMAFSSIIISPARDAFKIVPRTLFFQLTSLDCSLNLFVHIQLVTFSARISVCIPQKSSKFYSHLRVLMCGIFYSLIKTYSLFFTFKVRCICLACRSSLSPKQSHSFSQ